MDLVFVPSLEPERLLGLADLYHELGHIILYRREDLFITPGIAAVDRYFNAALHKGRSDGWATQSLEELELFHSRWRSAWLLEFASDLIATYLAGPAFGWCNIRTSTNLGGELYQGNESHPADDARAFAMGLMLEKVGAHEAAEAIGHRWSELTTLAGEVKPPRYDVAYSNALLRDITDIVYNACQSMSLVPWNGTASRASIVGKALNDAWNEFRLHPDAFEGYEAASMATLLASFT
jgi:hypothetical protein